MPGSSWSRCFSIVVALLFSAAVSVPADAQIRFDLPPQPLAQALTSVGSLANLNVYFDPALVDGHQAPALKADLSVDEALARLLAGTQLHAVHVDENTVRVVAGSVQKNAQSSEHPPAGAAYPPPAMHLAYVGDGQSINATGQQRLVADTSDRSAATTELAQVVVTAQKREERLQDVPVPVTAITADTLVGTHQLRIQDYYSSVPGLSMTSQGSGDVTLAIRGITTGYATNPSVGVTIDDVPYGSSSLLSNGSIYLPDIDPSDLARIEILRGPQGTLYGASSIGGLLKFVTADPSTQRLSGQVQTDVIGVHNGDGAGYGVRGSVNIPLGEAFAIRASAFTRHDPGYVDNPTFGLRGVNNTHVSGGHFSALWKPSADFSVKVGALIQNTDAGGNSDALPSGGNLQQATLPNSGTVDLRVQLYSATITANLGGMTLTSTTGYGLNKANVRGDQSGGYGGVGGFASIYGVTGAWGATNTETKKLTQEIRLTSSVGTALDWLVGGFYTHERSPTDQPIYAADQNTGAPVGLLADFNFPSTFEEVAAFADLTFHPTDRLDVQLGGRYSSNRQIYDETDSGPVIPDFFGVASPLLNPTEHSSDHAVTYLFTPEYKITPDLMTYLRLASGYRPGGPNADAVLFGFPTHYGADKTYNYEIGLKGNALDKTLSFDASVYYVDWKNIQISLFSATGFAFFENAGSAKSEGVELSSQWRPLQGLSVAAWISWNQATLTSDFPAAGTAVGSAGDRLPYSSRWSGNLSADYEFPLSGRASLFGSGALSYVGDREGTFNSVFTPNTPRPVFPAYVKTDLRTGLHYDTWTATVFLNNATDRRGVLSNVPALTGYVNYIQPRTVGLSIAKTF